MKCDRCGAEIPADERHAYQGKTLCEECYISVISPEKQCDPWATYVSSQERGGAWPKTADNLTDVQKKLHQFIRDAGRATRDQLRAKYPMSPDDLDSHLNVLKHSELVKERSEAGTVYIIPIPVQR